MKEVQRRVDLDADPETRDLDAEYGFADLPRLRFAWGLESVAAGVCWEAPPGVHTSVGERTFRVIRGATLAIQPILWYVGTEPDMTCVVNLADYLDACDSASTPDLADVLYKLCLIATHSWGLRMEVGEPPRWNPVRREGAAATANVGLPNQYADMLKAMARAWARNDPPRDSR